MMKLPIGTEVTIFERDGYESDAGVIESYDNDCVLIKSETHRYKIPKPKFEVLLTTKGNSLEQYILDN